MELFNDSDSLLVAYRHGFEDALDTLRRSQNIHDSASGRDHVLHWIPSCESCGSSHPMRETVYKAIWIDDFRNEAKSNLEYRVVPGLFRSILPI